MSVFNFLDYKLFVRDWVLARPQQGRGEYRRIAAHLRISSTMVSQIFNGEKHLNLEMAAELSGYFSFDEKEERFFFLLIELSRSGTQRLREKLKKQILELKQESQKIVDRVKRDKELTAEDKAVYYSSWTYTGLRNLIAVPGEWNTVKLAQRLQLPESQVRDVIQFLLDRELLGVKNEKFEVLAKATHLPADNPLVIKHHQNWRVRGFQKMDLKDPQNLFYTGPMSLSHADAERVRDLFLDFLQAANKLVVESPSETVRCMNIDWFEY